MLIDLGLAKLYVQGTQTIGAALAFTPGYAPPEQYQAAGATDQRTDVYGLGATLFYLLTGYQPTEAPARLSATALPRLLQLNPVLNERTEAAVLKAMALDPRERQQSVGELQADLREARATLTTSSFASAAPATNNVTAPIVPTDEAASRRRPGEALEAAEAPVQPPVVAPAPAPRAHRRRRCQARLHALWHGELRRPRASACAAARRWASQPGEPPPRVACHLVTPTASTRLRLSPAAPMPRIPRARPRAS